MIRLAILMLIASAGCASAESGRASWYGAGHHGKRTASGARFDMHAMTAAHRTLPLGSRVRVCAASCVIVTINDRGPFTGGRIIDLSQAAFAAIAPIGRGVVHVTVERSQ